MKQTYIEMKNRKFKTIDRDHNTFFSMTARINRQKISKDIGDLNTTVNKFKPTDI